MGFEDKTNFSGAEGVSGWEGFQTLCLAEKKQAEFLRHVTLINRNGIEWVDKCNMCIYYGEKRIASVYSSFDLAVVMLCRRMHGALVMAILVADSTVK